MKRGSVFDDLGAVKDPSAQDRLAALRTVCAYAVDSAEAAEFAQMLGLMEAPS